MFVSRILRAIAPALPSLVCTVPAFGLTSLAWVQTTIPPQAFTIGNATPSGVMPAGAQCWDLRATTTDSTYIAAAIVRATKTTGSFYRYSYYDFDLEAPVYQSPARRSRPSVTNPAREFTSYVSAPGDDGLSANVAPVVIGLNLSPSGQQVAGPMTFDPLEVNAAWGTALGTRSPMSTYTMLRLTFTGDAPVIGLGSVVTSFTETGAMGTGYVNPDVPIPAFPVPEPVAGGGVAMALLLARRIRRPAAI